MADGLPASHETGAVTDGCPDCDRTEPWCECRSVVIDHNGDVNLPTETERDIGLSAIAALRRQLEGDEP